MHYSITRILRNDLVLKAIVRKKFMSPSQTDHLDISALSQTEHLDISAWRTMNFKTLVTHDQQEMDKGS